MTIPQPPATDLQSTAAALVTPGKGLLAMDESSPTCNERFAAQNIPQTPEMRRRWRELIVTTPNLGDFISGAILYDETIREETEDGTPFAKALSEIDILPGIKVDAGIAPLDGHPKEHLTHGLDGLDERLVEYARMGARFAKWRAVIVIDPDRPSPGAVSANAHALVSYAALCQKAGLVPIVEPEVLMDGPQTLERCAQVTEEVLHAVFHHLVERRISLDGMLVKPNMVLSGLTCPVQATVAQVADATLTCLRHAVPRQVAGVAFLSGGQPALLATQRLNAMHLRPAGPPPWPLTFSFSRALQQPALDIWAGQEVNRVAAQRALLHRARCNAAASTGHYTADMEADAR